MGLLLMWQSGHAQDSVRVVDVTFSGLNAVTEAEASLLVDCQGKGCTTPGFEGGIDRLLARYEELGYLFGTVEVLDASPTSGGVRVHLKVDEGPRPVLAGVEAVQARIRPRLLENILGLRRGEPLIRFDALAAARRLERTRLFTTVEAVRPVLRSDSLLVLQIVGRAAPPGLFDFVVGYLPEGGTGGRGSWVGNGVIELRNILGTGRAASFRMDRLPGSASRVHADAHDPFVAGLPLHLTVNYDGFQQDSAYAQQRLNAELAHDLSRRFQLFVGLSRENVRPGPSGQLADTTLGRVRRGDGTFLTVGFRSDATDALLFPTRGWFAEVALEHGARHRLELVPGPGGDSVRTRTRDLQDRLSLRMRVFVSPLPRQVAVAGVDAHALSADRMDPSDLFLFGGATSLRGYDENRFRGRTVARFLGEYRYRLERASWLFVFFDYGFVERPQTASVGAVRESYPGYGLGGVIDLGGSLATITYAANPEDGITSGRIHVGLSLGL